MGKKDEQHEQHYAVFSDSTDTELELVEGPDVTTVAKRYHKEWSEILEEGETVYVIPLNQCVVYPVVKAEAPTLLGPATWPGGKR